jgi:hypothetical protein
MLTLQPYHRERARRVLHCRRTYAPLAYNDTTSSERKVGSERWARILPVGPSFRGSQCLLGVCRVELDMVRMDEIVTFCLGNWSNKVIP